LIHFYKRLFEIFHYSSMTDQVCGKFQLTESDNFEAFMQAMGVGYLTRKLGNQSKPLVTIESGGEDQFTMKTESLVTTSIINFKLGEPFEEMTGDGRKVLSTMSMVEPNKMMHQMLGTDGGKDSVCTREFLREKMVNVCQVDDVITTRVYARKE